MDGQASLFDPDLWCGRTSLEPSPAGSPRARTSASSLRKRSELAAVPFLSLDLTPGHGNLLGESYWEMISPWRGGASTRNTGVSPRDAKESSLWQILEGSPRPKYYLSQKACLGILRRACERGKELPEKLKRALEIQAGIVAPDGENTALDAYHINQRDEGIDLKGVSGALMATSNMQMQTFVTQSSGGHPHDDDFSLPIGIDGKRGCGTGELASTLSTHSGSPSNRNNVMVTVAFAQNQGDEIRNLNDVAGALSAQPGMKQQTYLCLNDQGGQVMSCSEDVTGTLRAQEHGHPPLVMSPDSDAPPVLYENHGIDSRYKGPFSVSPTLSARAGTGGNNLPLVEQDMDVFCITGNAIDRQPQNGGNGIGYQEDIAYTLTATDKHAIYARNRTDTFRERDVACTESARQYKDATDLVEQPYQQTVGTLGHSDHKGINNQYVGEDKCVVEGTNLIRRLTPLECERLQGFPDHWTDIPGASDSARYKALGNSVAIPCLDFVLGGIAQVLRNTA